MKLFLTLQFPAIVAAIQVLDRTGSLRAVSTGRNFGEQDCPCIGLSGVDGEMIMEINNFTAQAKFPADAGAHCEAWDSDRVPECQKDGTPGPGAGWCAQPWCFVDPCNCKFEHHQSVRMAAASTRGKPIFYSYETCGGQDMWSQNKNAASCDMATSEDACYEHGDCLWQNGKCESFEMAGICDLEIDGSEFGHRDCPCVLPKGINGTWNVNSGGKTVQVDANFGATCASWHSDTNGASCAKSGTDEEADSHCEAMWCYVDGRNCKGDFKPEPSAYLGENAKFSGNPISYSYITCGSEPPKTTATTMAAGAPAAAPAPAPASTSEKPAAPAAAPAASPGEERTHCRGCPEPTNGNPHNKERGEPLYNHSKYEDEWGNEYGYPVTVYSSP